MFERLRKAPRSERVDRVVEQVHELRDRGDQNEAERLLRRRHAQMPQEPEFALQLGLQLWDDGENGTDEARQLLRTAAALGSDDPGTLVRAASVMEALGGASE